MEGAPRDGYSPCAHQPHKEADDGTNGHDEYGQEHDRCAAEQAAEDVGHAGKCNTIESQGVTVFRGLIATTLMIAAAIEPVVNDTDLVRYGLTQGGLLAVVLVLLWSYRKDMVNKLSDVGDQLSIMTGLVSKSTEAQLKSAEAVERMARALEVMNVRREDRTH